MELLRRNFQEIRDFIRKKDLLTRVNLEGVKVPFWEADIVWRSPDEQHEIYINKNRGKNSEGWWCTKEILLRKVSEISYSSHDVLGVVEITQNGNNIHRRVFLDAREDNKQDFWTACARYENFGGYGKLLKFLEWTSPLKNEEYKKMSNDEFNNLYRNEQVKNGIRHVSELPPYIYIEATIEKFIDQINRRDFSQPVLVARNVNQEEIVKIEKIINDKRK